MWRFKCVAVSVVILGVLILGATIAYGGGRGMRRSMWRVQR